MASTHPIIKAHLSTHPAKTMGKIAIQALPLHGSTITRVTIQPGGSWSSDLKSHAGTESCEKTHAGVVLKGKLGVKMDDGREEVFGEGDAFGVGPGHDAWCVGEEECLFLEWSAT
jgi:quercetin dioxygenase-like cupin family protein